MAHHAIYIGDGEIVHFTGGAGTKPYLKQIPYAVHGVLGAGHWVLVGLLCLIVALDLLHWCWSACYVCVYM